MGSYDIIFKLMNALLTVKYMDLEWIILKFGPLLNSEVSTTRTLHLYNVSMGKYVASLCRHKI